MENKRIEAKVKAVKNAYRRMLDDRRNFTWKIFTFNPLAADNYELFDKGTVSKKPDGDFTDLRDFESRFDIAVNDPDVAKLQVSLQLVSTPRGVDRSETDFNSEIEIKEIYSTMQPQSAGKVVAPPIKTDYSGFVGALNMLGLVPEGLNGLDINDPSVQLGAVLQVRDQLNTKRWQDQEKDKALESLQGERDSLNTRVIELESEARKLLEKCEQLEDKLFDTTEALKEAKAKIESMHPNASVAGVALTQLGTSIAQGILQKNIGTIGKLFGLNGLGEAFSAAQQAEMQEQQPTVQTEAASEAPTVDIEPQTVEVEEVTN